MENKKKAWDESYKKRDNFVFYPNEEVIRFFSRHISKRIGFNEFQSNFNKPKVLDLGCGIGRHVIYANQMQSDAFGIDLSSEAIQLAKIWAKKEGIEHIDDRIIEGDITKLHFQDSFFDFILSHGVLDSMSELIAEKAIAEAYRVLKPGGLFYCDLICGDDSWHEPNFSGEQLLTAEFEKDTIQLYYNEALLDKLFAPYFEIKDKVLIKKTCLVSNTYASRYHIVFLKKEI